MHNDDKTGGKKKQQGRNLTPLATLALLAAAGVVAGALTFSGCATVDLRSDALIDEGVTDARAQKGRELLDAVAVKYGVEAWKTTTTTERVFHDDWESTLASLIGLEPWDQDDLLRMRSQNGSFEIRVDFLDGPRKGEVKGLEGGKLYLVESAGEGVAFTENDNASFVLRAINYTLEAPLRIQTAPIVLYDGERSVDGETYDIVFATWNDVAPNEADQYRLWINRETGIVDMVDHTLREQGSFFDGRAVYEDVRRVNGVLFAHKVTITDVGTSGKDGFIHKIVVDKVSFDAFPVSELSARATP